MKSYIFSSPTCDEIVLWMIEIWMKSHLVKYSLQQITTNVGLTSGYFIHLLTRCDFLGILVQNYGKYSNYCNSINHRNSDGS